MEIYLKDAEDQRSLTPNVPGSSGSARAPVYPSYVDLDGFVDLAWLKSLDGFVRGRIERRTASEQDLAFYTGPFLRDSDSPYLPGSKLISLSQCRRADDYYDLDRSELWEPSPEAEEFAPLMDFIASLPFEATGRIIIMYDPLGRAVSAHKDHDSQELCHEFIWMRTNLDKPFYMQEPGTGEMLHVGSHTAWFDTVNQFHGADETGALSFSIRVDGRFNDSFRSLIPWPDTNRASAPAHWASKC